MRERNSSTNVSFIPLKSVLYKISYFIGVSVLKISSVLNPDY